MTGRIQGSEMGVTLMHEHVFIDLRSIWLKPSERELEWLVDGKVRPDIMSDLLHHGFVCRDNLILNGPTLALKELEKFKSSGGNTIVDLTNRGLCPRPTALRELSAMTGLSIIAGCGYYVAASHPPSMSTRSVGQLAEEMTDDISEGLAGTDVRAGIIGEIGTSHPITKNEAKVLRAAARAQKTTGVSVNVHVAWPGRQALQVIRTLES